MVKVRFRVGHKYDPAMHVDMVGRVRVRLRLESGFRVRSGMM